jgi:small conductance mechanosensitive channel
VDLKEWVDQHGETLAGHGTRVVVVVVLALVVRALLHRAVNRMVRTAITGGVFEPLKERARGTVFDATPLLSERRRQRLETLGSVLRSVASFTVFLVAGTMVLAEVGLDLTPVVASAGILGVAVAFGAQNLVRDVLTGMFMLLEDQYGVGDVIDAGSAVGTVEAVTLRTTRLRDVDGTVWHVRNGEISRIGNRSQGWARAIVDVHLPLDADLAAAEETVRATAEELATDPAWVGRVVEEPEVWGLEAFGKDGLLLRVTARTAPLERGPVERELRRRLVSALGAPAPAKAGAKKPAARRRT